MPLSSHVTCSAVVVVAVLHVDKWATVRWSLYGNCWTQFGIEDRMTLCIMRPRDVRTGSMFFVYSLFLQLLVRYIHRALRAVYLIKHDIINIFTDDLYFMHRSNDCWTYAIRRARGGRAEIWGRQSSSAWRLLMLGPDCVSQLAYNYIGLRLVTSLVYCG